MIGPVQAPFLFCWKQFCSFSWRLRWFCSFVCLWLCVGCTVKEPSAYRQLFVKRQSSLSHAMSWLRLASLSSRSFPRTKSPLANSPSERRTIGQKNSAACPNCSAIVSYRFRSRTHPLYRYLGRHGRSFLYDNGLMLTLLAMKRRCAAGDAIVRTLEKLQNKNGSWGFSFDTWGNDYYNRAYVRTGSVAWAGYGLALFSSRCHSGRALKLALRAYQYIDSLRILSSRDKRYGLYKGGHGRWSSDDKKLFSSYKMEACVTEHQIDVYFFLQRLARIVKKRQFARQISFQAKHLAKMMIAKLWLPKEARFAMGMDAKKLDRGWALDAVGAWGALFLHSRGRRKHARRALLSVERRFFTKCGGIYGFRPYAGFIRETPRMNWDRVNTLFLEGTASVAVAYFRIGNRRRGMWLLNQLRRVMKRHGAVPYAIGPRKNFPQVASAASTLWFVFASMSAKSAGSSFWNE